MKYKTIKIKMIKNDFLNGFWKTARVRSKVDGLKGWKWTTHEVKDRAIVEDSEVYGHQLDWMVLRWSGR